MRLYIKFILKIGFITASIFFASLASARCEQALRPAKLIFIQREIPKNVRAKIDQEIQKLDPLVKLLKRPKSVAVYIQDWDESIEGTPSPGDGASFHSGESVIELSANFLSASRTARATLGPILQHEYGHALFIANMGTYLPVWEDWSKNLGFTVWRAIVRNILGDRWLPVKMSFLLSEPYQELFADLLVIAASDNPRIMARTLRLLRDPLFRYRSVTCNAFDASWNQTEVHSLFHPVKGYLWHHYLSLPANSNKKAEIIAAIFQTIAKEIATRTEDASLWELRPEVLNHRLLTALERDLRPFAHQRANID